MKEKIAFWVSQQHLFPYRFRKSFVKRTYPKILSDYQFEIDVYGIKYAGNTKDSTDRLLLMFGGCKPYMLSFMKDYCAAAKRSNFEFLDIGAHVGNYALFMCKFVSKLHAFETNIEAMKSLDARIRSNGIKNIFTYPFGLSNREETVFFNGGNLEIKTGDKFVSEQKIANVDLVKINIEGCEREIIEGFGKTIANCRPLVLVEVSDNTKTSFGSRDDFESAFPKDYCFYQFVGVSREKNSYKVAEFNYEQNKGHLDIIAIPREKSGFLLNKVARSKIFGGNN